MTLHDSPAHPADARPGTETTPADGRVTVRYWAGARAAAGTDIDLLHGGSVADLRAEAVARHPGLAPVAPLCTVLVDGIALPDEAAVGSGSLVEFLPPFAGG
ncbi:MAG: MoaD/ThiS family protein [Dermatophilaceae bacterium]